MSATVGLVSQTAPAHAGREVRSMARQTLSAMRRVQRAARVERDRHAAIIAAVRSNPSETATARAMRAAVERAS